MPCKRQQTSPCARHTLNPQPILSLPSNPFPSRSRQRRRRRGCRRWRAWRLVCSSPRRPWRPAAPQPASGDGGGGPAYPQPTLSLPSNPFPSRSRRRRRRGCWRCRALQYAIRAPWPARPTHSLVASPPLAACAPTHRVTGEASSEIVGQAAGGGTAGGGSSATVGREGCNGTGPLDSRSMVQIDGDSCIRSGTRAQDGTYSPGSGSAVEKVDARGSWESAYWQRARGAFACVSG